MSYTEFEKQLLVGSYLVSEDDGDDFVSVKKVIDRYGLSWRKGWIDLAIQSYIRSGLCNDTRTIASDLEQDVWLTGAGYREAERLLPYVKLVRVQPKQPVNKPPIEPPNEQPVPASNRIVRPDHNSSAYRSSVEKADELSVALTQGNDVGEMTVEEVAVAKVEVESLKAELQAEYVRADAFWAKAQSALKWIGQQAAGSLVGNIALALLAAVAALFGFAF